MSLRGTSNKEDCCRPDGCNSQGMHKLCHQDAAGQGYFNEAAPQVAAAQSGGTAKRFNDTPRTEPFLKSTARPANPPQAETAQSRGTAKSPSANRVRARDLKRLAGVRQPQSALEHNVRHHVDCKQTFDFGGAAARAEAANVCAKGKGKKWSAAKAELDEGLQIAVQIRCDVFRDFRARKINSTPGPTELFRVVNYVAAQHLANVPVALPDLSEVLAEVARSDGPAAATATVSSSSASRSGSSCTSWKK